jgi:hypothetical protein
MLLRSLKSRSAGAKGLTRAEPWNGDIVDVDRFWAEAWSEMRARQRHLAQVGRLADASWRVNQSQALIEFLRKDGSEARAPVQILGSWSPTSTLFTWAWDHPSVQTRLRAFAERTRWFGEKHALPELTSRQLKVDEREAWGLTAIAMKVNAARAAYRGPASDAGPIVFMALGDLSEAQPV